MSVDSEITKLIDAALAPVKTNVGNIATELASVRPDATTALVRTSTLALAVEALTARVAKLEGAPAPVPPPPPPPVPTPGGVPAIPAGRGDLYLADFSKVADSTPATLAGLLMSAAKLRVLTIPSDPNHLSKADGGTAAATDPMAKYCRYSAKNISISGGVLHQHATRRPDNLYDASFVGTSMDGHGGASTFSFTTGRVDFAFRCNIGDRTWTTPLWLIGWVGNGSPSAVWDGSEIDAFEQIGGKLTGNIHGPANTQFASVTPPADLATAWHIGTVIKTASSVELLLDGKSSGKWNGAMPHAQAIVSDVKVGIPWNNQGPTAATPDDLWLDLAWITVTK